MTLPHWECRNSADQKRLEAWTIERLVELDKQEILQLLHHSIDHQSSSSVLSSFLSSYAQFSSNGIKRREVVAAAMARDVEALVRLADTEELRRVAFGIAFPQPRGRGRAKGEPRPGDLPRDLKEACKFAMRDVERIQSIWMEHLGKRNRGPSAAPTAVDIAARRWGIVPDTLINYRKNRRRILRRK